MNKKTQLNKAIQKVKNKTNNKKIIISFNMNGLTTEEQYPENYKTIKDMNNG